MVWCLQDLGQAHSITESPGQGQGFSDLRQRLERSCWDGGGFGEAELRACPWPQQPREGRSRRGQSAEESREQGGQAAHRGAGKARRWDAYQVELRNSFVQEYKKHLATLDRLEQETAEATAQEANARDLLSRAMEGVAPRASSQAQAMTAWEQLLAGTHDEGATEPDSATIGHQLEELLREQATAMIKASGAGTAESVPGAPTQVPAAVAPGPSYYGSSPSVACRDPYLLAASPSAGEINRPTTRPVEPLDGGPLTGPILPMDAESIAAVRALKARVGVKEATKTGPRPSSPHSMSLADKEARRSAFDVLWNLGP